MTDERRLQLLESYYQSEVETMQTGVRYGSDAFLSRGLTRGLLIIKIMQVLELLSEEEAEKHRSYLFEVKRGKKENECKNYWNQETTKQK